VLTMNRTLPIRLAALAVAVSCASFAGAQKKSAPAPKAAPHVSAPAAHPAAGAAHPAAGAHPGAPGAAGHPGGVAGAAGHPGAPGGAGRPGGGPAVAHGNMAHPSPAGAHEMHNASGDARMRRDGRPSDVHDARRGMDIHHNLAGGGRRVETMRPDGRRLVYERGRPGYIGHPYSVHGREFERRAYYDHGRAYNRFYSPYRYHGYDMRVYAPGRYYPAAYYGWAYRPWGAPVRYGWGWNADPWYGYYGAYFTPYPVYASPSLWLTDYMLSQTLSAAYAANVAAANGATAAAYAGPALSADTKQLIAAEVQNDIALENQEATQNGAQTMPDPASSGIARLLNDGQRHVLVAGREADVTDTTGQECALTDGDVVQVAGPVGPQDTTVQATVLASKGGKDCAKGSTVALGLDEAQEMNNHLREKIDQGMEVMQAQQGKGGLPAAPASALAAPVDALVAQGAPPPDPAGAQELDQQDAQASQSEKDVLGATAGAPAADAPPPPPAPAKKNNDDLFK
jgi:hypothetical protein